MTVYRGMNPLSKSAQAESITAGAIMASIVLEAASGESVIL